MEEHRVTPGYKKYRLLLVTTPDRGADEGWRTVGYLRLPFSLIEDAKALLMKQGYDVSVYPDPDTATTRDRAHLTEMMDAWLSDSWKGRCDLP
jgi:hypothetical protein